ncbi:ABC transporter ATP-binding protein/permease [Haloplasma contractile]|uniref:Macrolide transport system ATP-binding-permease protein n=1 Tax=Haloplasma contractile SSD-17B TaxID=1033810 RepID=U2EA40_9MOLU|nr:ABC transporter ATP-binding protein [Haloplasma contractile]ERJ11983.1 macrolide transport system ATP-binding-permease protein [Haloplasma contractile SSD-17B]
MSRGDVILRLVELSKVFRGEKNVTALNNISTSFKRGEFVAVVGRSGSGKSTLINILGGLDRPTSGDYFCEGNNVSRLNEGHWDALRNKKIGFVFQNYFLIEYLTVYQNVEIALQFQNVPKTMKDAKIRDIIDKVGLKKHIHKRPSQLSGGQRQRVAIARALVKDPDIILADEPTGALDYKTADEVIKILKGESEDRLVVMVTHDRSIANKYANRIIEIENGDFKHDLVKEEIEQTYQNVFRKIKPVSLKKRDKFKMTFNKLKSSLIRNFFIAFSLALAFSFSIIFNGMDRGINDGYENYYDALENTDSNSFTVVTEEGMIEQSEFQALLSRMNNKLTTSNEELSIVVGNSADVIVYNDMVYNTKNDFSDPDLFADHKLRLLESNLRDYEYDKLLLGGSSLPKGSNAIMVTSQFIKTYYGAMSKAEIKSYVGNEISVPRYTFTKQPSLPLVKQLLNNSVVTSDGVILFKDDPSIQENTHDIRYMEIKVPNYCYSQEELTDFYKGECNTYFSNDLDDSFATYEDYKAYIDKLKNVTGSISGDDTYYNLLKRSNALYYIDDYNNSTYLTDVYEYIYQYTQKTDLIDAFYKDMNQRTTFRIVGIVDNLHESIIYMPKDQYNGLFQTEDTSLEFVSSFHTVHYKGTDHDEVEQTEDYKQSIFYILSGSSYLLEGLKVTNTDPLSKTNLCNQDVIADAKTKEETILDSVFYVNNYKGCMEEKRASSYLDMLNLLFSSFFNILMVAAILFYSMLIKVIFKARINEIGVLRSVGSTIKDIKRLFFYEVLYIFLLASILSLLLIVVLKYGADYWFMTLTNSDSRVISYANVSLLLGNNHSIVNISYINLLVQIIIVIALIMYLSNKNVSKVVNTNPIDILREVV